MIGDYHLVLAVDRVRDQAAPELPQDADDARLHRS
jgi:hypothetical protein